MSTYNATYPLSQRDQYYPNENVDWVLNFMNKTIQGGSVYLTGRQVVYKGGDPSNPVTLEEEDMVFYDGHVGAHGLFQTLTTSFSDRVVESFNHYPRWIKMKTTATYDASDVSCMSTQAAELKTFDQQQPENAGQATTCLTAKSILTLPADGEGVVTSKGRAFCVKIDNILNNTVLLPYSVTGEIKLTVQLSSVNQYLYGDSVVTDQDEFSFYLTDLELIYMSIPDTKQVTTINYNYKQSLKQIISSNNQVLNFKTPIPTVALACSFVRTTSENTPAMNYLQMDPLEGITRVDWSIEDMNQGILEYPLEHYEEMKLNYLLSMLQAQPNDAKQCVEQSALEAEDKIRGVGLNYLQMLANTKVSMNILSDASNLTQYAVYIYFQGSNVIQ